MAFETPRPSIISTAAALNPQNPIDDVVANLAGAIHSKGRGFTLGVVPGEDGKTTEIKVVECLKPHDEYRPPAKDRSHKFDDTPSLIAFASKYGTREQSIIFIGEERTVLVVDDSVEKGARETCTLEWRESQDWKDWEALLDTAVTHKALLKFLQNHEYNLVNPDMLVNLASISSTATVKHDSDMSDLGASVGVVFATTRGENLAKFPKKFNITVPVLDDDNDAGTFSNLTINVEVIMPEEPMKPITFRLYTSEWLSTWRQRIAKEEGYIRGGLADWLILKGNADYTPKVIGERA